jgi:predicted glycosyltransferase involved in capsule biosynthesis
MKIDLKNSTFIIPLRIESDDRLRNIITIVCFLLDTFNTNVIIKEVDTESVFKRDALPQIKEFLDGDVSDLTYIFEKSNDKVFYRMRYLNEMIEMSNTDIIINYDCDVLLKPETYVESCRMITEDNYDVVYPYGFGSWQKQIFANDELVSEFLSNDCDFSILEKNHMENLSRYGHVQFFNRKSYIKGGMENENFKGSSPEDMERFFRFTTLEYNVGRLDHWVYHLEHSRGDNSWPVSYEKNPHMRDNLELWDYLQTLNKTQLEDYYKNQEYLKKYN